MSGEATRWRLYSFGLVTEPPSYWRGQLIGSGAEGGD